MIGSIMTKSLEDPKVDSDGTRILVSRTYPSCNPNWDAWFQELGPRVDHLDKYARLEWTEEQLEAAYVEYLESHYEHASNSVTLALAHLVKLLAAGETVTLLCFEPEGEFCHRHILKRYLASRLKSLLPRTP